MESIQTCVDLIGTRKLTSKVLYAKTIIALNVLGIQLRNSYDEVQTRKLPNRYECTMSLNVGLKVWFSVEINNFVR